MIHVLNPELAADTPITIFLPRLIQQHAHGFNADKSSHAFIFGERSHIFGVGEEEVTFAGAKCVTDVGERVIWVGKFDLGNGGGADSLNYDVAVRLDYDLYCRPEAQIG